MLMLLNSFAKRVIKSTRFATLVTVALTALAQPATAQSFDELRDELMAIFNWNVEAGTREDAILGARLTIGENCGVSSSQILDDSTLPPTMGMMETFGNLRHVDPEQIKFSSYGDGVEAASLRIADGEMDWITGGLVLAEDPFFDRISSDLDSGSIQGSCTATECLYSTRFRFLDVLAAPNGVQGREQEIIGMFKNLIVHCQDISVDGG